MTRMVADLKGWPVGVWVASGPNLRPDHAQTVLVEAVPHGTSIRIKVRDQRGEYSSTLTASTPGEAEAAARVMSAAVGEKLEELGHLQFTAE
jgi:hypothetical protein